MTRVAAVALAGTLALLGGAVCAQDLPPLRVGVPEDPPFAMRSADGTFEGIAVDLWRLVAEELDLRYDYVALARGQAAAALTDGSADLVLAVDATPSLEAEADLTHPLYSATLGVVSQRPSRVLDAARHAASEAGRGRQVRTTPLDPHYVAIALPEGSDLREPMNRVLLSLLAGESGQGVIERYLPAGGP